jgi:hypothetical protein
MADTTMSEAFKDATDKLHERVVALGDQAAYQVRKNVPRAERALNAGYDEAADAVRAFAGNRNAQLWTAAAVGGLGLAIGLLLFSRRE